MYLKIKIVSKNKKSIKNCAAFILKNNLINLVPFKFDARNKIKKFTLLKSPHVNKTAQEQFEYRSTKIKVEIQTVKIIKFLIFLKNIQNTLFSDIKIEIEVYLGTKTDLTTISCFPDKFLIKQEYNLNSLKLIKTTKKTNINLLYLTLFDTFGEKLLKN